MAETPHSTEKIDLSRCLSVLCRRLIPLRLFKVLRFLAGLMVATICLLVCYLWFQSYSRVDFIQFKSAGGASLHVHSSYGEMELFWIRPWPRTYGFLDFDLSYCQM